MKFYFKEVKCDEGYLLWELTEDGKGAIATSLLDFDSKEANAVLVYDLAKVNHKQDISAVEDYYKIEDIAAFIEKFHFSKIEYNRSTKRVSQKRTMFLDSSAINGLRVRNFNEYPKDSADSLSAQQTSVPPSTYSFNLEKMIPVESNSTVWANTLAFQPLSRRHEQELASIQNSPFTTEDHLIHVKKSEQIKNAVRLKNERLTIIREIVENIFGVILAHNPLSEIQYNELCLYLVNAVITSCSNDYLDRPLDHEELELNADKSGAVDYSNLIQVSKMLEDVRVATIAQKFDPKNLPVYFKTNLEKHETQTRYAKLYQQLLDNIKTTGKMLRVDMELLKSYRVKLRSRDSSSEYAYLIDVVELLFVSLDQSSDRLVLSSGSLNKTLKAMGAEGKQILLTKMVDAFIIVNDKNNKQEKAKQFINYHLTPREDLTKDKKILIKREYVELLVDLLKDLFAKKGSKDLTKAIEACKVDKLVDLLNDWLQKIETKKLTLSL